MEQYAKIQQILKKEEGKKERKPIYPPTVIQAVFDAKTGASLEAILAQFNSIYVQYQGTPQDTRCIIPKEMRRAGLTITYMNMDSETITERAASAVQKDNDHWGLDINWSRVDELSLSGDISVSAQGTWIINGEDTGIKALGPKGDAGLTPWLKTIDNRLHLSYDNVNWEPCSEPIAAYFRFNATSGNTQSGTIGKIQISRDNKTWQDLSPEFTNNLHIAGYVATTSALPANKPVGIIYGVGPTYATEDTAQTNPIYRLYVYNGTTWVDNGQFTSIAAGIVQETGDSETEVMSQKATTEKLTELATEINGITFKSKQNITYNSKSGTILKFRITPNTDVQSLVVRTETSSLVVGSSVARLSNLASGKTYRFSILVNQDSDKILMTGSDFDCEGYMWEDNCPISNIRTSIETVSDVVNELEKFDNGYKSVCEEHNIYLKDKQVSSDIPVTIVGGKSYVLYLKSNQDLIGDCLYFSTSSESDVVIFGDTELSYGHSLSFVAGKDAQGIHIYTNVGYDIIIEDLIVYEKQVETNHELSERIDRLYANRNFQSIYPYEELLDTILLSDGNTISKEFRKVLRFNINENDIIHYEANKGDKDNVVLICYDNLKKIIKIHDSIESSINKDFIMPKGTTSCDVCFDYNLDYVVYARKASDLDKDIKFLLLRNKNFTTALNVDLFELGGVYHMWEPLQKGQTYKLFLSTQDDTNGEIYVDLRNYARKSISGIKITSNLATGYELVFTPEEDVFLITMTFLDSTSHGIFASASLSKWSILRDSHINQYNSIKDRYKGFLMAYTENGDVNAGKPYIAYSRNGVGFKKIKEEAVVNVSEWGHDPSIIKISNKYYMVSTNNNTSDLIIYQSSNLLDWSIYSTISIPNDSIIREDGETDNEIWAPEILLVNGRYYLSYAICTSVTPLVVRSYIAEFKDSSLNLIYNIIPFVFRTDRNVNYSFDNTFLYKNGYYYALGCDSVVYRKRELTSDNWESIAVVPISMFGYEYMEGCTIIHKDGLFYIYGDCTIASNHKRNNLVLFTTPDFESWTCEPCDVDNIEYVRHSKVITIDTFDTAYCEKVALSKNY